LNSNFIKIFEYNQIIVFLTLIHFVLLIPIIFFYDILIFELINSRKNICLNINNKYISIKIIDYKRDSLYNIIILSLIEFVYGEKSMVKKLIFDIIQKNYIINCYLLNALENYKIRKSNKLKIISNKKNNPKFLNKIKKYY